MSPRIGLKAFLGHILKLPQQKWNLFLCKSINQYSLISAPAEYKIGLVQPYLRYSATLAFASSGSTGSCHPFNHIVGNEMLGLLNLFVRRRPTHDRLDIANRIHRYTGGLGDMGLLSHVLGQ